MTKVSVITPWINNTHFLPGYDTLTQGAAEIIFIDNGSTPEEAEKLESYIQKRNGIYIRNDTNLGFPHANNQGMERASGEIFLFLSNDVDGENTFIEAVARDVKPRGLYGPTKGRIPMPWIVGWCMAGTAGSWQELGRWNDIEYKYFYFEDTDLSLRAIQLGFKLVRTRWPVRHFGNQTTKHIPGRNESWDYNREVFYKKYRLWEESQKQAAAKKGALTGT